MEQAPTATARLGEANICDPIQNIEGGVKSMRVLLDSTEADVKLTISGCTRTKERYLNTDIK